MSQSVIPLLNRIYDQCEQHLLITEAEVEPSSYDSDVVDAITHREWIPPVMLDYGREMDGFILKWEPKPEQVLEEAYAIGEIQLSSIEAIFGSWQEVLSLEREPANSRLHHFKIVDLSSEHFVVGMYFDDSKDPGLYLFNTSDDASPYPLYINIYGYISLLQYTLGYSYWQTAVLALLPDDGINPAYRSNKNISARLRRDLSIWLSEFKYDEFVAHYHRLKLTNYTPSGLSLPKTK